MLRHFPFRFLLSITITLAVAAGFCRGQEMPSWAKSLPGLPSRPEYYQGLGAVRSTGDAEADAQKANGQARAQIASQIRVRIVNTVSTRVQEVSAGDQTNLTDAFSSATDQMTEGTLERIVIERWFNKADETLYAYGAVSKAEVERQFSEKLQGAVDAARVYYQTGRRAAATGDAYLACSQYIEAAKVVTLAELYLQKSVTGDLTGAGAGPVLPILQSEICGLLNKLHFQVTGGDDQSAEKGRALPEPLSGTLLFEMPEGRVAARNALLSATFVSPARGVLNADSRTDEQGRFRFAVTEIQGGEAVSRIRVGLAVQGLSALAPQMADVKRCLPNAFVDFSYRLKTRTNVSIAMHILESNLDKPRAKSSVQEEIQKRLLGDRYTIIEESKVYGAVSRAKIDDAVSSGNYDAVVRALAPVADVIVVGSVSTRERGNPMPQMFFCTGTAVIRAIDAKSGRVIASVSVENEKEGGGNFEVAGTRLLERIGKKIGEEIKIDLDKNLQ
jgi:hypothetical protein